MLEPTSAAEAAAMLSFAREQGLCVAPIGGGTRRAARSPAGGIDLLLSTARLNRILEYAPADFIITAESGVTLAHLREVTAANGQWLALDPPARAASTLGGALSADASGPHPADVGGELVAPEPGRTAGADIVRRAAMPEAAVNEHRHLRSEEDDVRAAGGGTRVNPVAKARPP